MPASEFQPKQKRSEQTQRRLIQAVRTLLEQKYFEQIAIAEIAAEAGVSVGAFYRRFKNKESLLPLLYHSFQDTLRRWVSENESTWRAIPGEQLVSEMAAGICDFLTAQRGLVRTLHLNARLHSTLISPALVKERQSDYLRLAEILASRLSNDDPDARNRAQFAIFTLVSLILEKVIYPQLTPAIAAPQDQAATVTELKTMLSGYLCIKKE